MVSVGATFNGLLAIPSLRIITLICLFLLAGIWLIVRIRHSWRWQRTAFDVPILLGVLAIIISMSANPDTLHRSADAVWFLSLYVLIWYTLTDAITNGLKREMLVEAVLIAGFILVLFGYVQVAAQLGTSAASLPRPVSLAGNPNAFGAILLIWLPLALGAAQQSKIRIIQRMLWVYAGLIVVLLGLTFSRGAWLGGIASLFVYTLLQLQVRGWLRPDTLRDRWRLLSGSQRRVVYLFLLAALLLIVVVGIVIISSFTSSARSLDLRLYLWDAALQLFQQKPLIGNGIFTFGYYLPLFDSIPPGQPHSHAHNLVLLIAAEIGIFGLMALGVLIAVAFVSLRHFLGDDSPARPWRIAAFASVVGAAVHHLLDVPAMMPAVALMVVVVFVIAFAPEGGVAEVRHHFSFAGTAVSVGWLFLIGTGLIVGTRYQTYYDALSAYASGELPPAEAAHALQPLIDMDPSQPAYYLQQGYLFGLAAVNDPAVLDAARSAYIHYTELEPNHAVGWANLAALHWQAGDTDAARAAIDEAVALAPRWEHFQRQRRAYSEAALITEAVIPPESIWGANWARFQYLHDVIVTEYVPQVGWGSITPDLSDRRSQ